MAGGVRSLVQNSCLFQDSLKSCQVLLLYPSALRFRYGYLHVRRLGYRPWHYVH